MIQCYSADTHMPTVSELTAYCIDRLSKIVNNRSSTQLRNAAAEADVLADRAERALKAARARAGEEVLSCTTTLLLDVYYNDSASAAALSISDSANDRLSMRTRNVDLLCVV